MKHKTHKKKTISTYIPLVASSEQLSTSEIIFQDRGVGETGEQALLRYSSQPPSRDPPSRDATTDFGDQQDWEQASDRSTEHLSNPPPSSSVWVFVQSNPQWDDVGEDCSTLLGGYNRTFNNGAMQPSSTRSRNLIPFSPLSETNQFQELEREVNTSILEGSSSTQEFHFAVSIQHQRVPLLDAALLEKLFEATLQRIHRLQYEIHFFNDVCAAEAEVSNLPPVEAVRLASEHIAKITPLHRCASAAMRFLKSMAEENGMCNKKLATYFKNEKLYCLIKLDAALRTSQLVQCEHKTCCHLLQLLPLMDPDATQAQRVACFSTVGDAPWAVFKCVNIGKLTNSLLDLVFDECDEENLFVLYNTILATFSSSFQAFDDFDHQWDAIEFCHRLLRCREKECVLPAVMRECSVLVAISFIRCEREVFLESLLATVESVSKHQIHIMTGPVTFDGQKRDRPDLAIMWYLAFANALLPLARDFTGTPLAAFLLRKLPLLWLQFCELFTIASKENPAILQDYAKELPLDGLLALHLSLILHATQQSGSYAKTIQTLGNDFPLGLHGLLCHHYISYAASNMVRTHSHSGILRSLSNVVGLRCCDVCHKHLGQAVGKTCSQCFCTLHCSLQCWEKDASRHEAEAYCQPWCRPHMISKPSTMVAILRTSENWALLNDLDLLQITSDLVSISPPRGKRAFQRRK